MRDLLKELLGPIEIGAFFREHWEQAPYVVRAEAASWSALMSVARFEALISSGIAWPFVVGARSDEHRAETTRFAERSPIGLAEAHYEGWTLALQAANRIDPPLGAACRELGERLGATVMANVYLTPPRSRGYPPHYDTHENFLVQLEGKKRWSIWGSAKKLPTWSHLEKRVEVEAYARSEPLFTCVLEPGDVLYLPRGFVHAASAEAERSLHLTLNVSPARFADLLKRKLGPHFEAMPPSRSQPMFEPGGAIESLLEGVPLARFAAEHWERQPLHLAGAPDRFDGIATIDQIDELLSRQNLQHPAVQAFADGVQIPPSRFTAPWKYGGETLELVDDRKLLALFHEGATIRINGVEKLSVSCLELCRAIAIDTAANVAINLYVAPPGSGQNFDAHYDLCDAFVLQLGGTKTWKLWRNPRPLPLADEPHDPEEIARITARAPDREVTLAPGHLLYLPRGTIHAPVTHDRCSVHLLVAIAAHRWFDVVEAELERITAALMEDERWRRGFPMMPDAELYFDPAETSELFDRMVEEAIAKIDLPRSIRTLEKRMMARQHRAVPSMIENRDRFEQLSLDDRLQIAPNLWFQVEDGERSVSLTYFDRTLTLPWRARDAIHQIARERIISSSALDPKLDPEERLVIARRLLKEGFLVFARGAA